MLYATDHNELNHRFLDMILGLGKTGLKECILVNTTEQIVPGFQEWRWHLSNAGISVTIVEEKGNLTDLILKTVREKNISFVVGDFGRSDPNYSFQSAVKALMRELSVPLLIVSEEHRMNPPCSGGVFDRVMLMTDWSLSSQRAVAFLVKLSALIRRIDIITIVQENFPVIQLRDIEEKLEETRLLFSSHGCEAEYHIYSGKPIEEVLLAARDYNASAITLSAHRKLLTGTTLAHGLSFAAVGDFAFPMLLIPCF